MPAHSNSGSRRPYRLGRRLEAIEETRRRITAAAFELHATIGPSRTTVAAIAERAGVQRHTVYAHFPDLDALYVACTRHGMEVTAMPDPDGWADMHDPGERLRVGLTALYAWYRANERMLANVLHDVDPSSPPPTEPDPFESRMEAVAATLTEGWSVTDGADHRALRAAIVHATAFDTWRSLSGAGLSDRWAVGLMAFLVAGVASGAVEPGAGD